jgi:hypothetical protein
MRLAGIRILAALFSLNDLLRFRLDSLLSETRMGRVDDPLVNSGGDICDWGDRLVDTEHIPFVSFSKNLRYCILANISIFVVRKEYWDSK